jgi:hypothetical protein
MGRRIEVELTSSRDDGTWTWRAAGAKQPKGVVDATLLYEGARVGDVVRAEADFEIEGISITAVLPPKEKKREEPSRLEVIGPPREHQGVTSSLVAKSDRPRSDRPGRDRDGRDGRDARPRRDGPGDARRGGPPRTRDGAPTGGRPRPEGRAGAGGEGRPRPERGRPEGRPAERRGPRPDGGRPDSRERRPAPQQQPEPAPPKARRLSPANVHRAAVVAGLPPEQQPIAEHVLRGGIPAVRQAVEAQNARLREEGQPEVKAAALVALAEQILPQLKAAEWRDRAEAAAKMVDDVSLRDLRSVVAGADAARDDEGRLLAGTLRQVLERRVNEQRERWVKDITGALDEGRLVRALRLSAHPPDPASRFPADLAVRLSEAAGAAMTPEATPDRWATLLDAVNESPVRRSVKPAGLPAEPGEALLHAAHQASGRVPALAALLGITMPPPPGPPGAGRTGGTRGGRPPGQTRRRPPPPPSSPRATDAADAPAPVDAAPAAPAGPATTPPEGDAPVAAPTSAPVAEATPDPEPEPTPAAVADATRDPEPEPTPVAEATPDPEPPTSAPVAEATSDPEPEPPTSAPVAEATPGPEPEPTPAPVAETAEPASVEPAVAPTAAEPVAPTNSGAVVEPDEPAAPSPASVEPDAGPAADAADAADAAAADAGPSPEPAVVDGPVPGDAAAVRTD